MREEFVHQKEQCARWTQEGQTVRVISRTKCIRYRGKDHEVFWSQWVGPHMLRIGTDEIPVVLSAVDDGGNALGVGVDFTRATAMQATEAEREANRQNILQVATDVLVGMGVW
ncbi:MAG: hypothetical protein IKB79_04820 [Oscillospiraceae bacterium]|nr:hypothetical protein [Oscillospiraceae bacterium]